MATIAAHLSVDALRERYVSSSNAREARHFHAICVNRLDALPPNRQGVTKPSR
jgi:hypothetical protein